MTRQAILEWYRDKPLRRRKRGPPGEPPWQTAQGKERWQTERAWNSLVKVEVVDSLKHNGYATPDMRPFISHWFRNVEIYRQMRRKDKLRSALQAIRRMRLTSVMQPMPGRPFYYDVNSLYIPQAGTTSGQAIREVEEHGPTLPYRFAGPKLAGAYGNVFDYMTRRKNAGFWMSWRDIRETTELCLFAFSEVEDAVWFRFQFSDLLC
jgi:hypothetical protein